MINDPPCNHYVHYFRGFPFHPDFYLLLDVLRLSGPNYHFLEEVGVTLTVAHLLRLTVAAAVDALDEEVLACSSGPHCVFHPSTLPSRMISQLGRIWSMELTRLIQHGLKRVFRPFLPLLLLFWCPLSLPFIPWCPLLRAILLPLTASVIRLILHYHCHLIGGISVIRSFHSSSSSELITP